MTVLADVDVAVIGAGVVGCALARELSGYGLSVALVDARDDVGDATSKANTALIHTGFDATPGTLEAGLVARGHGLLREYAATTGIAHELIGAVLVAWTEEEAAQLPALADKAVANGYPHGELLDPTQIAARLPQLAPGALGGLAIPDEGMVCPWTTSVAFATEAVQRGTQVVLGARVLGCASAGDETVMETSRGDVRCRWVVNAAGLGAHALDGLWGFDRFEVRPRRGELVVFDKLARPLVPQIVLPVPTERGKGVLVAPTIYGNVMVGPTAEDVADAHDTATTRAGIDALVAKARQLVPGLAAEEVTATYAGVRAATDRSDYLIALDEGKRYVLVGGIRSTGLTAAMAIAEHVRDLMAAAGVELTRRSVPEPPRMPSLGEHAGRPFADGALIACEPSYGQLVCFCERVSAGELDAAWASALPPTTVEGLRRRTRAGNGRCQGFFCGATLRHAQEVRRPPAASPTSSAPLTSDVLVVGAGPAGLTAAAELAKRGLAVTVIEREQQPGGIPRHSHHTGYGWRDLRRVLSGPEYARRLVERSRDAGAHLITGMQVTGWAGERAVEVTSPQGRLVLSAGAVVLATGARERPRSARLIPGDRPDGVMTTGELQQRVHLFGERVGRRAVIIGAEPVSWSAVLTLREAGCATVALVTAAPRSESYAGFRALGRIAGVPVWTHSEVAAINGRGRVRSVTVRDTRTGATREVACDTVITTGDWVGDHELVRLAGIDHDGTTTGPVVDAGLRTSRPGVLAIGNLVHPVDTADGAAGDGAHAVAAVSSWLSEGVWRAPSLVRITATPPLRWVTPQLIDVGAPTPRGKLLAWSDEWLRSAVVTARQGGGVVGRRRVGWPVAPGRIVRLPASVLDNVAPEAGPVELSLDEAGRRQPLR